ncbi:DVU_1553 family AMP-dependent CoA ligase [Desulfosporosinus sp. FKB]|uniref:DVU_1553 family AMP-dependent CoA ligase n=1 Tax=Desulfosporosinus sp. FKB TaxID=1969835 RepID=UPI000B4A553C|nr:AMP-binding protein [Desulfosporosinus sp. FKB]
MAINVTPLEPWVQEKITGNCSGRLTRKLIEDYQLNKLQETIAWVSASSRFYRRLYQGLDCKITSLADINKLPFTTSEDLKDYPLDFLCVSQDNISRIVTLQTSGTTGKPKRLFFSEPDQELTIDFFHHGMFTLIKPGDRVLILLPGETTGSVGDLLRLGLARAGVTGSVHGIVSNPEAAFEQIKREKINVLVGIPTQVLNLARFIDSRDESSSLNIKSVLLSTDYVPLTVVKELQRYWGCQVFNHYGMTEMGLGGGIECEGFCGYHLREADLYFEIIDPLTGTPVIDGRPGEIVFTTLTRSAMPLVRYRTGDISRFIPGICACNTVLKRLERVKSRDRVFLNETDYLTISDFDEVLFEFGDIIDFEVTLTEEAKQNQLNLNILLRKPVDADIKQPLLQSLAKIPILKAGLQTNSLQVNLNFNVTSEVRAPKSSAKRQIQDRRRGVRP